MSLADQYDISEAWLLHDKKYSRSQIFVSVMKIYKLWVLIDINCGYSLKLPWQGNFNVYPQLKFLCTNM